MTNENCTSVKLQCVNDVDELTDRVMYGDGDQCSLSHCRLRLRDCQWQNLIITNLNSVCNGLGTSLSSDSMALYKFCMIITTAKVSALWVGPLHYAPIPP